MVASPNFLGHAPFKQTQTILPSRLESLEILKSRTQNGSRIRAQRGLGLDLDLVLKLLKSKSRIGLENFCLVSDCSDPVESNKERAHMQNVQGYSSMISIKSSL